MDTNGNYYCLSSIGRCPYLGVAYVYSELDLTCSIVAGRAGQLYSPYIEHVHAWLR